MLLQNEVITLHGTSLVCGGAPPLERRAPPGGFGAASPLALRAALAALPLGGAPPLGAISSNGATCARTGGGLASRFIH